MGSIVNAIGRAISGIADAIKKIAPALLLAAAIYVGYGFMTGFQAGGWPQILNWGKSLVSGITQGDSISGATAAADVGAEAESTTDVMSAVAGGGDIATAGPVAEAVAETADTAITGSDIGENTVIGSRFVALLDQIGNSSGKLAADIGSATGQWLMSTAQGDANVAALEAAQASTTTDTATGAQYGESPEAYAAMFGPEGDVLGSTDPNLMQRIMAMGGKAWNIYKNMWKTNPGMAMWTTNNILRTILAMMDTSAEEEAYAAGHVAGFAPDTWANIKERVGGKLPGGRASGAGVSAYMASRRPSSGLKVGPLPEANRSRTSAIDRKPAGIIGPSAQRTV
jgi:hypothetical protein